MQRLNSLIYGAKNPDVARRDTVQGRPPGGRSDAARRAYALVTGPGCTKTSGSNKAHPAIASRKVRKTHNSPDRIEGAASDTLSNRIPYTQYLIRPRHGNDRRAMWRF